MLRSSIDIQETLPISDDNGGLDIDIDMPLKLKIPLVCFGVGDRMVRAELNHVKSKAMV